jgi:preprotein translocase subunit SecG
MMSGTGGGGSVTVVVMVVVVPVELIQNHKSSGSNSSDNSKGIMQMQKQLGPRRGKGKVLEMTVSETAVGPEAPMPTYLYVVSCT